MMIRPARRKPFANTNGEAIRRGLLEDGISLPSSVGVVEWLRTNQLKLRRVQPLNVRGAGGRRLCSGSRHFPRLQTLRVWLPLSRGVGQRLADGGEGAEARGVSFYVG